MDSDSSSPEYDSSSSCSPASPDGDTPVCSQRSPPESLCSASSMDSITKDTETSTPDSFVPTVTAISTSPALKWMVQPTTVLTTSVSPASLGHAKPKAHSSTAKPSPAAANKAQSASRKGQKEQPPKVDDEKRRIRRERNKIAAAKCRNRRRELTDTLQAETDELEEEREALQSEIDELLKEKERLEQILAAHTPACKLANDDEEEGDEDDVSAMLQDPPASPQILSMLESSKSPERNATTPMAPDVDAVVAPCISPGPAAAILGNSNILLCSSAEEEEEETLADLRGDDLDDLVPSLEMAVTPLDAAAAVPDIDLVGGPFCLSDWETLYRSVASDLESPVMMSSSPACSSGYRTVFSFNHSELDSMQASEGCESLSKGSPPGLSPPDVMKDSLNSPTLLAL